MATHSSILAWSIQDRGDYSPWGHKESDTTERLILSLFQVLNSVTISHLTEEEDEAQRQLAPSK